MRTLSKKTQYTLRALYGLARTYGQGPTLIATLAKEESIPQDFLENILLDLKREGLVESKKGKGGGYLLASDPETVTLAPLPCASETAYRKCDECVDAACCGTRMVMREVRDAMAAILDRTTLAQVCRRVDEASANAESEARTTALMYYI